MTTLALLMILIPLGIFLLIMLREPRTLWSGISFFILMASILVSLVLLSPVYVDWLGEHEVLLSLAVFTVILAGCFVVVFPALLIFLFLVEGFRLLRREGFRASNLLSLLFAVLLCAYLVVWPFFYHLEKKGFGAACYAVISFCAVYLLTLMAMYTLSALLNLIHIKKCRNADYIIVLGAGIMGKRVPPLLAARLDKGMALLEKNPHATLILSGGQGPGEDIAESEAMAAYVKEKGVDENRILMERRSTSTEENLRFSGELMEKRAEKAPEIIVVTTAYHVFRALVLAKKEGIKCVGYGAKTKWYFTLNALIREFVGYLRLTWKRHVGVMAGVAAFAFLSVLL